MSTLKKISCLALIALSWSALVSADEPNLRDPTTVKLLIFGGTGGSGGNPSPDELRGNVEKQETLPIDGLAFNLSNNGGYFANDCMLGNKRFTFEQLEADIKLMKSYKFKTVRERFVRINNAAGLDADWFDDASWNNILQNIKVASRGAKESGATGFFMDNECYNFQPFNYTQQKCRLTKSFDEYRNQVRKRGTEFIQALSSSYPRPVILMLYANATCVLAGNKTPLASQGFGLWPAFLDGMMDGNAQAEFIDGFEQAYEYRSYAQFKEARDIIKGKAGDVSQDPERYRKRIKVGFGLWLHASGKTEAMLDKADFTKNNRTPDELKHALYYAMALSDGYVWLYAFPWFTLPKEYSQAIQDARKPQALDFKPLVRAGENEPAAYIISTKGRVDCADSVVFAAHKKAGYTELYDFPKAWKFRLDPQNVGVKDKWFTNYEAKDYMDIEIGDWWEPQLKKNYLGYAWYRFELEAPISWHGKKLLLTFGAVDEEAWVYLNGEFLGDHAVGPDGWNNVFELDASNKLKLGAKNAIYVRVYNSAGVGGIFKSVKIFTP